MIRRPIARTVVFGATLSAAIALVGVLAPSTTPGAQADDYVSHHEFQVNCGVSHTAPDDPIVYPSQPGVSHNHTFLGATTTDAYSTTDSLSTSPTTCLVPADHSAYWFPTLYNGNDQVLPNFKQVIYYKSGILDYQKVVPFPKGLRFVTGNMMATQDEFRTAPGAVEGFECGDISKNWDIPSYCAPGSQMNIRYQAPSCWDGMHLTPQDAAAHHFGSKNMAYPVNGVCPAGFPIAVPMIEFKMAFPLSGDMSAAHFASGRGYSWHYDFFNAWDPQTLDALVSHCINGGLQCDPRGYDQYKPNRGSVLDANYELIH